MTPTTSAEKCVVRSILIRAGYPVLEAEEIADDHATVADALFLESLAVAGEAA